MRDGAEWGTTILCPSCEEDTVRVFVVWLGDEEDRMHYNYKCNSCGDQDRWQRLVRKVINGT